MSDKTYALSAWHLRILRCLDVAMIVLSVSVLSMPAARHGTFQAVFLTVFFIHNTEGLMRTWRMGFFNQSPQQMMARFRAGERVSTGVLERIATGLGFVALFFIIF